MKKKIYEHAPKLVVINNIFFNIFTDLQVPDVIRQFLLVIL